MHALRRNDQEQTGPQAQRASPARIGVVEDSHEDYEALRRVIGTGAQIERWESGERALQHLSTGALSRFR